MASGMIRSSSTLSTSNTVRMPFSLISELVSLQYTMWCLCLFNNWQWLFFPMYIAAYECVDEAESSAVSSVYWSSPGSILCNTSRDRQIGDWWSWAPGFGWWGHWEIRLCSGNPVPRPKSGRCRDASSVDAQPSQHRNYSTVISAVSSTIPFPWVN